jgi:hypothetical protein
VNGTQLFARIVITGSLVLGSAACSSQSHHDNGSKSTVNAPQLHTPQHAQGTQTTQQLVAVTWCDPHPQKAGYRTVQKFDLNGTPVGKPAYFNVALTEVTATGATEASCSSGINGAEMSSAFVGDSYDAIVTTKVYGSNNVHEGFEYSVSSVPAITNGSSTPDPTPNNFYDITGLSPDSATKVIDLPGAMSPSRKVYFVRVETQVGSDTQVYVLMKGDANTPAKPIRQVVDPGAVFFAQNDAVPYIASDDNTAGRGVYIKGGTYGFEGTSGALNFGTQQQLSTGNGTSYKVTGIGDTDILHPFHVYNKQHLLASTQEGIYDVTISGNKATAKKLFDATGNYIGDAQLVGNTIMFNVNTDAGDNALYTVSVTGDTWKKVHSFPHGSTGDVNILGTVNAS